MTFFSLTLPGSRSATLNSSFFSKNINQMFQRPAGVLNIDAKTSYWTTAIFDRSGKVIEDVNPIVNRARIYRAIIKRSNCYLFCNGMKLYKGL